MLLNLKLNAFTLHFVLKTHFPNLLKFKNYQSPAVLFLIRATGTWKQLENNKLLVNLLVTATNNIQVH